MRSDELYRLLRRRLGPWYKAAGFRRAEKAPLGWQRRADEHVHLAWAHCDKWGWDPYTGSGFFFTFQLTADAIPWSGRAERLQWFLSDDELVEAEQIQNRVIASLAPPPAEHVEGNHDLALRYFSPSHVDAWADFLLRLLPRIHEQMAERLGPPA